MSALGAGGLVLDGPPMVPPKFATARDLSRPTLGSRQAVFARDILGQPFMPWQKLVADVAGELVLHPTGVWVPAYKLVVVTVQRQAGKSHLCLSMDCERCFSVPAWRSWYTAQTGQDARDLYLKFDEENLDGTLLRPFVRTMRGRGEEVMKFANRSTLRPHPPTEQKLHGKQSDRNNIDEGWAFPDAHGKALMQAIAPTQGTRWRNAQTVVWSAGGTASSTWLAELVARGRAGDPAIAYFEWAIPDDLALDDLDAIAQHHPAYGYTFSLDSIQLMRTNLTDDAEFARAAGNRWTEIIGGAITGEQWTSLRHGDVIPESAPLAYGAARAADGSEVAIVAAAQVDDDLIVVELLDVLPTAYKAGQHVKAWAAGGAIAVAGNGPSAALATELDKLRTPRFKALTTQQESAAVTNLLDSVKPRRIQFRQHPALDAAVRVAGTRGTGDGGKAWARVAAGASIAPIEAATYAVWALATAPRPGRLGFVTADD